MRPDADCEARIALLQGVADCQSAGLCLCDIARRPLKGEPRNCSRTGNGAAAVSAANLIV